MLRFAGLFLLFALMACDTLAPAGPHASDYHELSSDAPVLTASRAHDQSEAEVIGRALAKAAAAEVPREDLYLALSSSDHPEQKLELASLLASPIGENIRSRMLAHASEDPVAMLESLPSLEVYLPVASHRAEWTGEDPISVAVAIHEDNENVRTFDSEGRVRRLDPHTAPPEPTLVITKSETDFSEVSFSTNRRDAQRISVPSAAPLEAPALSSAPACPYYEPADTTPGLYLRCIDIYSGADLHEPWYRGDPEIEIHYLGQVDATYVELTYCTGEHSASAQLNTEAFDQNSTWWQGEVRILPSSEVIGSDRQFLPSLWEDDDNGPCRVEEPSPNNFVLSSNLDLGWDPWVWYSSLANYAFTVITADSPDWTFYAEQAGNFILDAVQGLDEDDHIGVMVDEEANNMSLGWANVGILDKNENEIGKAFVFDRHPGYSPPLTVDIYGPTQVSSAQSEGCEWSANVSGGSSPYDYQWYINGRAVVPDGTYSTVLGVFLGSEANDDFHLSIEVTDNDSTLRTDQAFVAIDPSYPSCLGS